MYLGVITCRYVYFGAYGCGWSGTR